jgi:tetratricopeptide (TPR) repeat protein
MTIEDWETQVADAWESFDQYEGREDDFRGLIEVLARQAPEDTGIGDFERACAWDSTGHSGKAVPLYESALERGLTGERRRRAVIQLASSLRNIGQAERSVELLRAELEKGSDQLDDAVKVFLALALTDVGREREAVSIAVGALARHLPRYQRSSANYARLLLESRPDPD